MHIFLSAIIETSLDEAAGDFGFGFFLLGAALGSTMNASLNNGLAAASNSRLRLAWRTQQMTITITATPNTTQPTVIIVIATELSTHREAEMRPIILIKKKKKRGGPNSY